MTATPTPENFPWDSFADKGIGSRPVRFMCEAVPTDGVVIQTLRSPDRESRVALYAFSRIEAEIVIGSGFVTPATARKIAAALLDAADDLDGTAPLNFLPGGAQ